MAIFFLDTSALVKRYVNETGSTWISELFDPGLNHEFFIAAIALVEMIAAISRRSRGGGISSADAVTICRQIRDDLQTDYQIIQTTESIINSAMTFAQTYRLRAYDAIQLAASCAVNTLCIANNLLPITLVSADVELNTAALEGLLIEDPNQHQ